MRTAAFVLVMLSIDVQGSGTPPSDQTSTAPLVNPAGTEMATYYVVLLRRGPAWTATVTPETAAVSKGHMDNIQRLTKEGRMVVAGPFLDQSGDRAPAGLFILRAASLAEAQALTESDPAVKAGRFVFEIMPWAGPTSLRY